MNKMCIFLAAIKGLLRVEASPANKGNLRERPSERQECAPDTCPKSVFHGSAKKSCLPTRRLRARIDAPTFFDICISVESAKLIGSLEHV